MIAFSRSKALDAPIILLALVAAVASMVTSSAAAAQPTKPGAEPVAQETTGVDGETPKESVDDGAEQEWPYVTPAPEPRDGKWLVDEQGEYFIERYPRIEGRYRWVDEEQTIVRLRNLPPVKVLKADDAYFYFRVNRAEAPERVDRSGPSEEELEAVAATYPGAPEERDLHEFQSIDQGLPMTGQWRNGFDLADMNGDGYLDIVHGAARKGGSVPHIFLGSATGEWRLWDKAHYPDLKYDYGDIAAADLNGDGHLDLALAVHLRGMLALLGDGDGSFRPFIEGLPWAPTGGRTTRTFSSRTLAVADWDKDGRLDLVTLSEGATGPNQLEDGVDPPTGKRVFLNRGDHWEALFVDKEDPSFGDHILVADLDADGRLDLVTDSRRGGNRAVLAYGTEDGLWESVDLDELRQMGFIWAVESADLNGDGRVDLAVSYHNRELGVNREGIDVFFGGEGRTWRRLGLYSNEGDVLRAYRELAVGDLDGDGHKDLVGLGTMGGAIVLMGGENETWYRETSPELDPDPQHEHCVGYRARLADLDRDGDDELIAIYAGEPGSESMRGLGQRCTSRGAIRAWNLTSAAR